MCRAPVTADAFRYASMSGSGAMLPALSASASCRRNSGHTQNSSSDLTVKFWLSPSAQAFCLAFNQAQLVNKCFPEMRMLDHAMVICHRPVAHTLYSLPRKLSLPNGSINFQQKLTCFEAGALDACGKVKGLPHRQLWDVQVHLAFACTL